MIRLTHRGGVRLRSLAIGLSLLAPLAASAAGGGFTADEWAAYIPEVAYQPTCPE